MGSTSVALADNEVEHGLQCQALGVPTSYPATQSIYYERLGATNISSTPKDVVCPLHPPSASTGPTILWAEADIDDETTTDASYCHVEAVSNGYTMYSSTKRSCYTAGGCGMSCYGDFCLWGPSSELQIIGQRSIYWSYPFGTGTINYSQIQIICTLPSPGSYGNSHVTGYQVITQ